MVIVPALHREFAFENPLPNQPTFSLPTPDALSAAHSAKASAHIAQHIAEHGGAISFEQFMGLCLYAPGLGYYSAGSAKFSEAGDFTTAPEISPLFAGVLARQCAQVFSQTATAQIMEFGAGTGHMAADLLNELGRLNASPEHYYIVEVSADLRARQHASLMALAPQFADRVQWLDDPASTRIEGVIIANEVLDALPVERFRVAEQGGEIEQQRVRVAQASGFETFWHSAPDALSTAVRNIESELEREFASGYESEIALQMPAWLRLAAGCLTRGVILLSDYGYGCADYYSAERSQGTLTCHFRQHAHHDPLRLVGIQDITAWVDFSAVAQALDAAGLGYLGYTSQTQFLLAGGVTDLLEQSGERASALSRGLKTLTLPGEMGERFRFIGFHNDMAIALSGFAGRDYGGQL